MPHSLRPDVHIANTYTIAGHTTDEVFQVGRNSDLWPRLNTMELNYLDTDPYIKQHGRIALAMTLDALPRQLAHLRHLTINGSVTQCDPEQGIVIAGGTPGLAAVEIGLSFTDTSQQADMPLATFIHYETDIELKNFLVRKFGKSILRQTLDTYVPQFCEQYRDNVIQALQTEPGQQPA